MTEHVVGPDDPAAVGWAFRTGSPTGRVLRERIDRGEKPMTLEEIAAGGHLAVIRQEWEAAGRPLPRHHLHREALTLGDGTVITPVSFLGGDPDERATTPAFGLYLDERWAPPWPHEHFEWPDFGLPSDAGQLRSALDVLLTRARQGETVEIGCLGGHGRTGTALACLAVLTGTPPAEAVAWVREHYCERAVETEEQRAFVVDFGR